MDKHLGFSLNWFRFEGVLLIFSIFLRRIWLFCSILFKFSSRIRIFFVPVLENFKNFWVSVGTVGAIWPRDSFSLLLSFFLKKT